MVTRLSTSQPSLTLNMSHFHRPVISKIYMCCPKINSNRVYWLRTHSRVCSIRCGPPMIATRGLPNTLAMVPVSSVARFGALWATLLNGYVGARCTDPLVNYV